MGTPLKEWLFVALVKSFLSVFNFLCLHYETICVILDKIIYKFELCGSYRSRNTFRQIFKNLIKFEITTRSVPSVIYSTYLGILKLHFLLKFERNLCIDPIEADILFLKIFKPL